MSKIQKYQKQGQRQLGLDFIWDNGQLTWINKQLGSTIDQDKKNPLGLTINLDQQLTWIDSQLLQHIYRPIAAHLLHYCSMFKILLQHIYGTIRAHLPHHYSIFNYSNIAEHKIQIIYLGGKLLY